MSNFKTLFICHSIVRIVLTICITVVAIHFGKINILWWYIVPGLLMSMSYERKEKDDGT